MRDESTRFGKRSLDKGAKARRSRPISSRAAFVLLICLAVALLRYAPVFVGYASNQPGRHFSGLSAPCLQDFRWYLSFVYQEKTENRLFLENRATLEEQEGRFFPLYFILVGLAARVFDSVPIPLVWTLAGIVTVTLFLWAVYRLLGLFFPRPAGRWLAFGLVCLCSGWDYVGALLGLAFFPSGPEAAEAFRDFPLVLDLRNLKWVNLLLDLKVGGMIGYSTFAFLYNAPALFSYFIFLLIVTRLTRAARSDDRRLPLAPMLLFPLIFFSSSISAAVLYAILFFLPAVPLLRNLDGRLFTARLRTVLPFLLPLAVPAAMIIWARGDPVCRSFSRSYLDWPLFESLFFYPLGFGPLLFFAILGWRNTARLELFQKELLIAWLFIPVLLGSNPIMGGYRFLFPLHIPLCILGAMGLELLYDRIKGRRWIPPVTILILLTLAFLSLNNLVMIAGESVLTRSPGLSLANEERMAFRALEEEPKGRVFCSEASGANILWHTPHKAFIAHWSGTVDFLGKREVVARFFDPRTPIEEKRAVLEDYAIDYLFYGRREREAGDLDPLLPLEPIFRREEVSVFRVISEHSP